MKRPAISDRGWLWLRFTSGIAYLGILSVFLGLATNANIPFTFAILLAGATVATIVGLTWLGLWARRTESQLGQFQIGSLFFFTAMAAMLFGAVRWTASHIASQRGGPAESWRMFAVVTAVWLLIAALSLPFVLGAAEAVMWAGVCLIRQPLVRRGVRLLFFKRNVKQNDPDTACEKSTSAEWRGG